MRPRATYADEPDFDPDASRYRGRGKGRAFLGSVIIFIASGYYCITELRYLFCGRIAQATYIETFTQTHRGRYGSTSTTTHVRYRFTDEAMANVKVLDRFDREVQGSPTRVESDRIEDGWEPPLPDPPPQDTPPAGRKAPADTARSFNVQYLPGSPDYSRLEGNTRAWLCIPFILSLAAGIVFGIRFWQEYKDHERRKAAS